MILRFLFYAFLIYLLYRLVFGFIIPVVRTTLQVRRGFREMKDQMQQAENSFRNHQAPPKSETKPKVSGDYIDFEEIKEG